MGSMFGTLAKHYSEGGWMMHPILVALIFTLAVMIDRIIVLYFKAAVDKESFLRGLKQHVFAGDLDKAIAYCAAQKKVPLVSVIKAGLINVPKGEEDVQAAMDEATLRESPRIEARTGYLAMLGNVATLVGLLGTILGLIHSFAGVAGVDPSMKATLLAKGISEAMNCTAFGLICAVPALLQFALLNGWTQSRLDDINEVTVQVVNLVVAHRAAMKGGAAAAAH